VISFEADVKPLFRDLDREAMRSVFDLWEYADVRQHATSILERLESGSMPCDEAWPEDRVSLVAAWIDDGMRP
jgi:hypothetical protein